MHQRCHKSPLNIVNTNGDLQLLGEKNQLKYPLQLCVSSTGAELYHDNDSDDMTWPGHKIPAGS